MTAQELLNAINHMENALTDAVNSGNKRTIAKKAVELHAKLYDAKRGWDALDAADPQRDEVLAKLLAVTRRLMHEGFGMDP